MMTIMLPTEDRVAAVRAFNRFYTARIGVLREGLLDTRHPLPEARVLFEVGAQATDDLGDLRARLDVDAGYLSRLLGRLEDRGLVVRERVAGDARRRRARLTAAGRRAFATLDRRSGDQIAALLSGLRDEEQRRLLGAMGAVEGLLGERRRPRAWLLRPPRIGELGWIVQRHGALYAAEYGWDAGFEALVARVVADYAQRHDPAREAAWIAEVDGEAAGCVLCVADDAATARLRLLLVEPHARGLGIGGRLVDECVGFARRAGYRELVLWTNDVLVDARRLYERAGFRLVRSEAHRSFGHDLVGQDWALDLQAATEAIASTARA
jgi:DNA-binding MarR family transcriptional regulator/GNAT superfamily N-acetyltransferase